LEGVESLRALAALMIITYHMVMLPKLSLPGYLAVIKQHFGLGVPLFYALSGFVLAYGYMDKFVDRRAILKFYVRRYFRIAPLFYFMIVVWMVATKVKWGYFPAGIHDVVLNLVLLFGFVPGKHESIVWAGWSIGVEIIFYIVFPLVAAVINSVSTGILALAITILVSSSFYSAAHAMDIGSYAYLNIITHFPTFIGGVLGYLIWRKMEFKEHKLLGGIIFIGALVSAICVIYSPVAYQALISVKGVHLELHVWSIIFMMLIVSICLWPNRFVMNPVTRHLGRISFSLYLWHPLIIIFLMNTYALIGVSMGSGLMNFFACALVTLLAVTTVAVISFRLIEAPGMAYGKRIANGL
jgi:peptidoglycan/LPS O-acetylase OafA/YrhL